jgi:hypothetical protein
MIGLSTHLVGAAGAIFLAASLVPGSTDPSPLDRASPMAGETLKGDMLSRPMSAAERATVSIVELVGVARTTVILRDRDGNILFRSDPVTNTTLVARDVELPVVTLKEEERSPVVPHNPVQQQHREGNQPPAATGRKARPLGCEGAVSPLAKGHNGTPSLCLAALSMDSYRS